jgi:cytochrome c-type biogenesis protein
LNLLILSAPAGSSIGLVFLAGMAAFLSPCTMPILPGYLAYLAARATGVDPGRAGRWNILAHGLAFVFGFGALFILLGATASVIGRWLLVYREWIARAGGVLMIILGLSLAGVLRLPFLQMELRPHLQPDPRLGYLSSFCMGFVFAAGWTPCIGPVLASVLMLAALEASLGQGILLLAVFTFGLGIPFLLIALLFDQLGVWVRRLARLSHWISIVTGLLLALIGFLLAAGQMGILARWLPSWEFGV